MISAEDVLSTTFRTTRFRGGYDIEEVDDYLDEVTATLAVHEGRAAYAKELLTAQQVADRTFEVTKLRESYVVEDVDALLGRIGDALRDYERRAATRTTGSTPVVARATGAVPLVPSAATGTLPVLTPTATGSVPAVTGATSVVPGQTAGAAARVQDVGASVAPVPPGAVLGLRVLTSQLQIATVRTRGSDTLTVRTPDGSTLHVVAVDAGPDGVVLRTTA